MKKLSRRRFLQGTAGITLSLPFLTKFAKPAWAAPSPVPLRMIVVTYAMGTVSEMWRPDAAGANFNLPFITQPLDPFKDRCLFVSNCDNSVLRLNGDHVWGHPAKKESVLTGTLMRNAFDGDKANRVDRVLDMAVDATEGGPNNESICNFVGNHLLQNRSYLTPSVDLAVAGRSDNDQGQMNSDFFFEGPANPISLEANPATAFNNLFAGIDPDDAAAQEALRRLRVRNKSVLDAVRASFTDLRQGLDAADRARLDDHADRIRTIELDMGQAMACTPPVGIPGSGQADPSWDLFRNMSMNELAGYQTPLLAHAMACDMAPIGRLQFKDQHNPYFGLPSVDDEVARWVAADPSTAWHGMVHGDVSPVDGIPTRGDGVYAQYLLDGYRFFIQKFADLLAALDSIEEDSDGTTVLDNTLVVLASDYGNGNGHGSNKLNFVLAGNTGAARNGYHFDCAPGAGFYDDSDYNSNQLLNSICRMFDLRNADGSEVVEFGLEGFVQGGIPGLF